MTSVDKMTNEEIYDNFCSVSRDTMILNRKDLDKKYEKFKRIYPKIYEMAINSVLSGTTQESLKNLQMFLKTLGDISDKKISKENADMFIGNQLGKEYIYPLTGAPTNKDYERAVKKIKQDYTKKN
jgi:hypothetical protein